MFWNSNSAALNSKTKHIDDQVTIPNDQELKIANLEEDLAKKTELIDNLKSNVVKHEMKYADLYRESKSYSARAREIIAQTMREMAEMKRKERA